MWLYKYGIHVMKNNLETLRSQRASVFCLRSLRGSMLEIVKNDCSRLLQLAKTVLNRGSHFSSLVLISRVP